MWFFIVINVTVCADWEGQVSCLSMGMCKEQVAHIRHTLDWGEGIQEPGNKNLTSLGKNRETQTLDIAGFIICKYEMVITSRPPV